MKQLLWTCLLCWAVKLSTNRTNLSRSLTDDLSVVLTHFTEHAVSVHAFSCHKTSTFGCHASFSSYWILFPFSLKIITILSCSPSPRMPICKEHCLFSSPDEGWLIQVVACLSPSLPISCLLLINDIRHWWDDGRDYNVGIVKIVPILCRMSLCLHPFWSIALL